jgi:enoyl-CoA hydratase/carnithine racemase
LRLIKPLVHFLARLVVRHVLLTDGNEGAISRIATVPRRAVSYPERTKPTQFHAVAARHRRSLVMDYVLAADDAYLTLPARKEGIIPAMANLRLPRFVGDRLARQAIMNGRRINCDSPEGRLICDEVTPADQIDGALAQIIGGSLQEKRLSKELASICEESFHLFHHYYPRRLAREQGMVLAIEWHKSGIRYRAREKPALTEGDEIVANAMKDDCRNLDHRQQVDDINLTDGHSEFCLTFA